MRLKILRHVVLSVVLLTVLLLQGCETSPVASSSAQPIPDNRIVELPTLARGAINPGQLIVTRDAGFYGGGMSILLTINAKKIAYFRTRETLSLDLASGDYVIAVAPHPALGASSREYEVHLNPGEKKNYRLSITQGGIVFQRSPDGS